RDARGRARLEEVGVEDLRADRREGVHEADEPREVRLVELGRRQVRRQEGDALREGLGFGPELLRLPRDPGQVEFRIVEARLADLVDLLRERLAAVRRGADAHRAVVPSRSLYGLPRHADGSPRHRGALAFDGPVALLAAVRFR